MASSPDLPRNTGPSDRSEHFTDTGEFIIGLPERVEGIKAAFTSPDEFEELVQDIRVQNRWRFFKPIGLGILISGALFTGAKVTGITDIVKNRIEALTRKNAGDGHHPRHPALHAGPE